MFSFKYVFNRIKSIKVFSIFTFIVLVFILTIFYYKYHFKIGITSDSTTMLPVAYDLLSGNILLKDWILGTNNFIFSETIFYTIGIALGINLNFLVKFIPGIFYSLLIVSLIYTFVLSDKKLNNSSKLAIFIISIALIGILPLSSSYTLLNANSHNNLYFWVVLCIFLALKYLEINKKRYIILYLFISTLMSFSESVTTMVLHVPIIVFCILNFVRRKDKLKYLILSCITIVAYLIAKFATFFIENRGGLITEGIPINLVSIHEVFNRIREFIPQIYYLFGFDGISEIGLNSLNGVYNLIIFILLICCALTLLWNTIRFLYLNDLNLILYSLTIINIAGCIFTDVVIVYRYIVPAFLFGFILTVKTLLNLYNQIKIKKDNKLIIKIIIAILIFIIISTQRIIIIKSIPNFGKDKIAVADFIIEKDLGDGYGDFWCSSLISYYTNFEVSIYPIYANSNFLIKYPILVKTCWYKENNKHFIINFKNDESICFKNSDLIKCLGEPDEQYIIGQYIIFYWDKDISKYFN